MAMDFAENFWGPKYNGFDVLYHNMKFGLACSKELAEFFRERSSLEEAHSKSFAKLAKLAANGNPNGTFAPLWQVLRSSSEKISAVHLQMVQKVSELVKDLTKYADELQKKYKSVKEEESGTLEIVQTINTIFNMVQKSKEAYFQRAAELDKYQKENASQKDIEKAETKAKKAYEEYKAWVEKHSMKREEFDKKMTMSCVHFQEVETMHVTQMKSFVETYCDMVENNHEMLGKIHLEFRNQCNDLTLQNLLEQFVNAKGTGKEKPAIIEVEEPVFAEKGSRSSGGSEDKSVNGDKSSNSTNAAGIATTEKKREGNIDISVDEIRGSKGSRRTASLLNLFIPLSQGIKSNSTSKGADSPSLDISSAPPGVVDLEINSVNGNTALSRSVNRGSKWFLRSRRDKKKEKKQQKLNKKKDTSANLSGKDDKSDGDEKEESQKPVTPNAAEVDEEGYTVRPNKPSVWEQDKSSFYSSSDSDSDEPEKRIHVDIKPLSNGNAPLSASVDELRSTVEKLTLSPLGMTSRKLMHDTENQMKRSQSVSQQIGSSNNSPPSRHPYAPLSPPVPATNVKQPQVNDQPSNSRYADLGDLFAEVGEMQPALPLKQSTVQRNTPTPTSSIAIPRPPSRPRNDSLIQRSQNQNSSSPAMSRTESIASLESRSISHSVSSRGPSPLTIGMSDTIPIAVAFHEIIHACFRANDENLCQVRMTGDMMVSFPAGIIQILSNNPSPAQLSFRVKSAQRLENLVPNKDLIKVKQEGPQELAFEFDMSALTQLLRKHSEQNPSASFFNVDILKYYIVPKPGASSCPLHLVAYWKCESSNTDLKIDYKYNSHSLFPAKSDIGMSQLSTIREEASKVTPSLVRVGIAAPVDGGVKTMQSKPSGTWSPENNKACWKFPLLGLYSDNQGVGSLRARFEVTAGPSSPGTIAAQFSCDSATLSGCEFQLIGPGYRVSLIKNRFISGMYTCEAEEHRYAVPP